MILKGKILSRILGDEQEALDLAQEAFVKVYRNKMKFNVNQKFTTWLYAIGSNLARDRIRWRIRHPSGTRESMESDKAIMDHQQAKGPSPSEQAVLNEEAEIVRQSIAALPEGLRIPLVLAGYEKWTYSEIAETLGATEKAVEMKVYHARKELKQLLAKWIR